MARRNESVFSSEARRRIGEGEPREPRGLSGGNSGANELMVVLDGPCPRIRHIVPGARPSLAANCSIGAVGWGTERRGRQEIGNRDANLHCDS